MDCQLLCLLAASIGFSSFDDVDRCGYCGDVQVTMDECIDLRLTAGECQERFPDQQVYVYCLSVALKYNSGAVNIIKRCVDKDAYKADVLTLDKQILNVSHRCLPNKPSLFQSCQCGDLCHVRTTMKTEPTTTEPPTSLSTNSLAISTTTTTTTTTTENATEPSTTASSPLSTTKIATEQGTTAVVETIVVADDEPNNCSHLCASSFLILVVLSLRAVLIRDLNAVP